MKKSSIAALILLLTLSLTGCKPYLFPWERAEISGGTSPDDLIPPGESVTITTEASVTQLKIKEVIDGDRLSQLTGGELNNCTVVVFNMQVSDLSEEIPSEGSAQMILKNGILEEQEKETSSLSKVVKALQIYALGSFTFGAEGSCDFFVLFHYNADYYRCLKYINRPGDTPVYFALK